MKFHVLTLFPEMVMQSLSTSITGRAMKQEKIDIEAVNIRDFSTDKHRKVDDYTYGGGAGMLMQAQPVYDAAMSVFEKIPLEAKKRVIYVTPQGHCFDQQMAKEFAGCDDLVFLCGHYEGIDERVLEEVVTDYVSIGDYVLTGGELAAMVMIDAISRLVPGVLKNAESAETESFSGNLLEYPQYSRPEIWRGKAVPEVLLSGDSKKIRQWRIEKAEERTRERRPDLYKKYEELLECRERLMSKKLLHMDMIDLIDRGKAELVLKCGGHILLREIESGFYYHTAFEGQGGQESESFWSGLDLKLKSDIKTITLHQPGEIDYVRKYLSLELMMTCYQYVCTRREKLSVSGLYRTDGKENENGLVICPATQEYCKAIDELYSLSHGPNYIRDRIDRGCLFVALVHGELAGFVGMHEEGGLGMLEVLPQFRRQHVALALSTFIINWALEQGYTPYSQAKADNEASIALQDKLDIHRAKEQLFWMGTFT